jgi:hypothetical protein
MRTMPLSQLVYLCSLAAGFALMALTVFAATVVAGLS